MRLFWRRKRYLFFFCCCSFFLCLSFFSSRVGDTIGGNRTHVHRCGEVAVNSCGCCYRCSCGSYSSYELRFFFFLKGWRMRVSSSRSHFLNTYIYIYIYMCFCTPRAQPLFFVPNNQGTVAERYHTHTHTHKALSVLGGRLARLLAFKPSRSARSTKKKKNECMLPHVQFFVCFFFCILEISIFFFFALLSRSDD